MEEIFNCPPDNVAFSGISTFTGSFPKDIISTSTPIFSNPENKAEAIMEKINKADRFNEGKPKWSLVHFASLVPMIRVLEFGAKKYAPRNWMKPMDTTEILESMQRHLAALLDGEIIDSESGISHMGHIQCNAMFYNYHINKNNETQKGEI